MSQSTHHPNHCLTNTEAEREIRTLLMELKEEVNDATNFEHSNWVKRSNLILYSRSVRQIIPVTKTNKTLNDIPPPIADEERNKLSSERATREF